MRSSDGDAHRPARPLRPRRLRVAMLFADHTTLSVARSRAHVVAIRDRTVCATRATDLANVFVHAVTRGADTAQLDEVTALPDDAPVAEFACGGEDPDALTAACHSLYESITAPAR
jgi:hypothetical protein